MRSGGSAEPVPLLDLRPQLEELAPELETAARSVLRSGRYILGPEVEAFEREVAEYLGCKHAVGVNSGTDALVIALRALGIGPGDEVVTTAFSFVASAESIVLAGARPVFADVDPRTFNLDPDRVARRITPRTRAILPVHLFGQPAALEPLLELARAHRLRVLEDVAQAFGGRHGGRRLGSFGDAAAFSFFPTKNLGACGDGGLVATDDDAVADEARRLRVHGARGKYRHDRFGYNSRLDAIQAAILRVKLPRVDGWNDRRRRVARRYDALLRDVPLLTLPAVAAGGDHVYHQYTVRIGGGLRDRARAELDAAGIGTQIYYPLPLPRQPILERFATACPRADAAAAEVLSLPIWPGLPEHAQERVASVLRRVLEEKRG